MPSWTLSSSPEGSSALVAEELAANVRTVCDLADYLEELKAAVLELAARIRPQTRGHFTPQEEDSVRGILISYAHSRNALFEVIHSLRARADFSDEDRLRAFLAAFAAALALVDAARFLRETVHAHDVVRAKLNEPALEFGIEAGLYDHVQRSLVSVRHAWHLYHAVGYLGEHERALRDLADAEFPRVLPIIDRLRHRLDVSVTQFARTRLRHRASSAVQRLTQDVLRRALYGLQKLGCTLVADRYVRRGHRPALPPQIAAQLRALIDPGDVLIVRKEFALTNYFLPGYWPHAALFLGDAPALRKMGLERHPVVEPRWDQLARAAPDEPRRVLESMKDGVRIRSLASPFAADSVVVIRPRVTPEQVAEAIARGLAHEGKPYDFDFDLRRSDRLVCTEVVYRSFDGVGPIRFQLQTRAGRPTLSGADLVKMSLADDGFRPVAAYAPKYSDQLAVGLHARRLIASVVEPQTPLDES